MADSEVLYNAEFQRGVLKLICTNTVFATDHGSLLQANYFELQPFKIIFDIAKKYVLTYDRELDLSKLSILIDEYGVARQYDQSTTQMIHQEAKMIFDCYVSSERFVVDKLVAFVSRQAMKNALIQCVEIIDKGGDYERALTLVNEAVSVGAGSSNGMSFADLRDFPLKYRERYDPKNLVRTGFPTYDSCLSGGMAPGELHVLLGTPKSGKSTLACNIGCHAAYEGEVVYHITLELKEIDILAKYATRLSKLTFDEMVTVDLATYQERMRRFFEEINPNVFVKYWTEYTANALTIRSWISRMRTKTGKDPTMIIVDYDDCLVPVGGTTDDMYEDAGRIYADLIALADYFKCPVLTLAQPKREAWNFANEGKILKAQDLAHSAKKAHKAYSISSLNFKDGSEDGYLYCDMVRRGKSHMKIMMKRIMDRAVIFETKDVAQ